MEFDETKPEPIVTPDTPNRTKLNPEDAPPIPRADKSEMLPHHYRVLNLVNRGTHHRAGNNLYELWTDQKQMRRADNLALFDAVSCQLDVPEHQRRWARKLFDRLDLRHYSQPNDRGKGSVMAAVCTCAYVCWRNGCKTHPNHADLDERFDRFLNQMGLDRRQFRRWYGRFEEELRTGTGRAT